MVRKVYVLCFFLFVFSGTARAQTDFVYVNTNNGLNSVAAFSVAADGVLTPVPGSPFLTGGFGSSVGAFAANRSTVCTVGNRLYVSNDGSNSVSAFNVDPSTGILTTVPGSPFATGGTNTGGTSLDCASNGQFLFASNATSKDISVFAIDAGGALIPVVGSPFPVINTPIQIKLLPGGGVLYVVEGRNLIEGFTVSSSGSLTAVPGSPFSGGPFDPNTMGVAGVEINCAGTLLFAPVSGGSTVVSVFNIAANGAITPIVGSPFTFSGPNGNSLAAILHPNERLLFVTIQFFGVAALKVATNGALTPVLGSPFPAGGGVQQLSINRTGTVLYVNNEFGSLHVLRIAGTGALDPAPGSPFAVGSDTLPSVSALPAKSCAFDICLQDDSSGNIIQINSITGAYQFNNCHGLTLAGGGVVNTRGCLLTLQVNGPDRRVSVKTDLCSKVGTATVQSLSTGTTFTISDRNTANNTCSCPGSVK